MAAALPYVDDFVEGHSLAALETRDVLDDPQRSPDGRVTSGRSVPMKEVLDDIERWRAAGQRVAVARVVGTEGSSPRDPGATMAVSEAGEVAGSVSGGCVEGAVVQEALEDPRRRARAGHRHVRLLRRRSVRGRAHVRRHDPPVRGAARLVEPVYERRCATRCATQEPVALATVVEGPHLGAKLLVRARRASRSARSANPDLDRVVARDALGELEAGLTSTRHYGAHGEARERDVSVFIESFVLPPRMVIFGAVDFTAALAKVAKVLGYRVTVCDARAVFATVQRFPMADEVVNDWPDRYLAKVGDDLGPRDAVCVLTHDHKFDVPAIAAARDDDGRLPRRDGFAAHARGPDRAAARGRRERRRDRPGACRRSASTSAPARPRRRRSRSAPRSSRCAPGASAQSLRDTAGPIH